MTFLTFPGVTARVRVCMRVQAAVSGRPGASYVDLPSNILMGPINQEQAHSSLQIPALGPDRLLRERPHADGAAVAQAAQLLTSAQR